MPLQPPRLLSVLAGALAATGIVLSIASCGRITPLGPEPAPPQAHVSARAIASGRVGGPLTAAQGQPPPRLRTPFILRAVRVEPPTQAGGCPAGSVALSGGPGQCYGGLATPVTVTAALVGPVLTGTPDIPPGLYGFWVTLPAADLPALHALTTAAADAQGFLDISVAGRTWLLPRVCNSHSPARSKCFSPAGIKFSSYTACCSLLRWLTFLLFPSPDRDGSLAPRRDGRPAR